MMKRLRYIDNLRVFLTVLVILHHTAIAYGASGGWYFRDPGPVNLLTSVGLTLLAAVNQAFFMSLFFFVSAYFTPDSLARKGTALFLRDRLLRLGLPLFVYTFLLNPILVYTILRHQGVETASLGSFLMRDGLRHAGTGPLWFVLALLLFAIVYTSVRRFAGGQPKRQIPFPPLRRILLFCVSVGLFTFGIRLIFPTGWEVLGLQPGYFPLYVCMYVFGIWASQNDWLEHLPRTTIGRSLAIALTLIAAFPVVMWKGGLADGADAFSGGWTWQALTYALWEPFVCVGISMQLLHLFRMRFYDAGPVAVAAGRSAYTAYILHPFFVVGITMGFVGWALPPAIKFVLVGALAVASCFVVSDVVRRFPLLRRVL